jgi:hypothetical protein
LSRYCPYDRSHKVLAKRFQYHIIRCAKVNDMSTSDTFTIDCCQAYPHIRRVKCAFNATHLTAPNDLFKHMSTCPDNQSVHDAISLGMSDFSEFIVEYVRCMIYITFEFCYRLEQSNR